MYKYSLLLFLIATNIIAMDLPHLSCIKEKDAIYHCVENNAITQNKIYLNSREYYLDPNYSKWVSDVLKFAQKNNNSISPRYRLYFSLDAKINVPSDPRMLSLMNHQEFQKEEFDIPSIQKPNLPPFHFDDLNKRYNITDPQDHFRKTTSQFSIHGMKEQTNKDLISSFPQNDFTITTSQFSVHGMQAQTNKDLISSFSQNDFTKTTSQFSIHSMKEQTNKDLISSLYCYEMTLKPVDGTVKIIIYNINTPDKKFTVTTQEFNKILQWNISHKNELLDGITPKLLIN